ncbi:MAG: Nucleotidyltransferase/DNA polymerase involved in DNA repair [Candidatus Woesebacteria bacterium GW2011_GWA2_40_7]|uniref:Nucleotidyltransferase/DNA polymerase involved in DNA repair n=3 Tax=Candidatus Woeseibacteriota TaxID=1752722 RepID=A0A0G0UV92_9BACT|nr:MAG: Nucleotidyltransferase/DNA polymerase involved in DNA repair [Candidatus Woesebacteria bacterium GW2011_GWB1_39_10]KKR74269.1 MAG: Nucleotidyltransferase/DNA polymerase involved in DNA repair [Candidatus Woesebacteria bacterium GW2011_GWA2_40_7]KKR92644.1 MAG: Nucleotidyltransferase/DNA polymerase involved in DNA repair [Candidatus Woesebacteria bacterium GW2011_GWA1_41_13b]
MHIDLNSCFATIEQQANPFLRGKPIAVAAYTTPNGCILAASIEAKKLGIKTGMRVRDGKTIYPDLIILPSDPNKYRDVHIKLKNLILEYTNDFTPKSIDEFVLNLENYPTLKTRSLKVVAQEIKDRIKTEIGEWLTVSIGIAPNRYLAKIAAGLHKPDGLDEINSQNFLDIYSALKLTDLTGIKNANAARLNSMGIYSVLDFYQASVWRLKAAFHSITGLYWHTRLAGYEADSVEYQRRSYGNSVALGKNLSTIPDLSPVLARLTEKTCSRLRRAGYTAGGIHLFLSYKDGKWWHKGKGIGRQMFDPRDIYKAASRLLLESPSAGSAAPYVLNMAVSCSNLDRVASCQLDFFNDVQKKEKLVEALDDINEKWGDFTISMARSMGGAKMVIDRIAFGGRD